MSLKLICSGTTRICLEDYRYKDLTIPKGTSIQINMEGLHFDKELWKDPGKFNPERCIFHVFISFYPKTHCHKAFSGYFLQYEIN